MAENFGIFTTQWVDEDGQDLDPLPVLDEVRLRARLTELGAQLGEGDDEGVWSRESVEYDFLLCRGSDGRLRMVDGSMHYLSPTTSRADAQEVFTGLYALAGQLQARLWLTGGGGSMPEPLSAKDVQWWIAEVSA